LSSFPRNISSKRHASFTKVRRKASRDLPKLGKRGKEKEERGGGKCKEDEGNWPRPNALHQLPQNLSKYLDSLLAAGRVETKHANTQRKKKKKKKRKGKGESEKTGAQAHDPPRRGHCVPRTLTIRQEARRKERRKKTKRLGKKRGGAAIFVQISQVQPSLGNVQTLSCPNNQRYNCGVRLGGGEKKRKKGGGRGERGG